MHTPLEDIRVIDITTAWAGPMCSRMFSDMGAEVIKIENPALPDGARMWPPFADNVRGLNRCGWFSIFNRGKKDCLLDLKTKNGKETFKELVSISDIVVENFSPNVMEKLGFGYTALCEIKPNIIMVSLSGYGATGPDRDCVAYGNVLEAYAGLSAITGYPGGPPFQCGPYISDHTSAVLAAFATLSALHYRDISGKGQHIDVSEVETLASCMPEYIMDYTVNGIISQGNGNKDDAMAPHGCYRCSGDDKWVAIAVESDDQWQSLCSLIGEEHLARDVRFKETAGRLSNQEEIDKLISKWTISQSQIELFHRLQAMGVPATPVYTGEDLFNDIHLRERGFIKKINHPEYGEKEHPGIYATLSNTPGLIQGPEPLLGEHNDWVYYELLNKKKERGESSL